MDTKNTAGLNIDPVLKRTLKGIVATALAAVITVFWTSILNGLTGAIITDPTLFGGSTAIISGILLGIEKALPTNF